MKLPAKGVPSGIGPAGRVPGRIRLASENETPQTRLKGALASLTKGYQHSIKTVVLTVYFLSETEPAETLTLLLTTTSLIIGTASTEFAGSLGMELVST